MKLINNKTGLEVQAGDQFTCRKGRSYTVHDMIGVKPHKPSSTGKICVVENPTFVRTLYPSVLDCKWVSPTDELIDFAEKVYELAFGEGAVDKGYTDEEVLLELKYIKG